MLLMARLSREATNHNNQPTTTNTVTTG
ncbi:Protein of unknown function [Propionibacterium freudenreichii]|uniref:Uncharacterized protein n=2 Tax=Propionibacterium freudenreichii TaxID=1744 RepID=D7GHB9_PROFC|nr:Hypothetical protein PFREUD_24130 [Propionibacterium freudenreichii subsp. shermanii CIRM-BIA1]CDP48877.1 Putative uncharacterized protein [Propionibacterium freudenreichii subsp. freudenreichii]CEG87163.1 Protein of unknown function [Propionibacterium freudenreichii]CEG88152.1 Protein of unknown function [Propionibacterium freudenreichii]CEG92292.1 Protein of unknown function [Propionibacterium freudenreichii]